MRGTLAELGIRLRNERPGEHRAACPECARTKQRPRDDALAVRVESDGGATWCCHRCGWRGGLPAPGELHRAFSRRAWPLSRRPPPKPDRPPAAFSGAAERLWRACRPIEPDTPAGRYLLEARGCALPHPGGDLRWDPELWNAEAGCHFPAIVGLVTDAVTGEAMGVHRTWLAPDGSGKASVPTPRKALGPKKDGVIRLWPDEELTTGLCVAEGIETALAATHGFQPVWSTLDAGNLAAFPVLPGIEGLTVIADHDQAGLDAARACAQRWLAAGVEVRLWHSLVEGEDFNDFAREAAA